MKRLIIAYNADSGPLNAVMDAMRKMSASSSCRCRLCDLTHGPLRMKQRWRTFLETVGIPIEFRHRDDMTRLADASGLALPAILLADDESLTVLLDADAINGVADLSELIERLAVRLKRAPMKDPE